MRKAALLVLVVLVLLGAAMLWQAPATLVSSRVDKLSGGRIALADADGTVWRGAGVVALGATRIPVTWQLHPMTLVRGEVGVTLAPATGTNGPRASLRLGEKSAHVQDLDVVVPAAAVVPLLLPRPRLAAGGDIEFRSADFGWSPAGPQGSLAIDWRGASLGLAGGEAVGLGTVSAALSGVDGRLTGPVRNEGGEFALDGVLTILPNGGGEVRGTVKPRNPGDRRIDALAGIGRPEAGGVALEWRWPGH